MLIGFCSGIGVVECGDYGLKVVSFFEVGWGVGGGEEGVGFLVRIWCF